MKCAVLYTACTRETNHSVTKAQRHSFLFTCNQSKKHKSDMYTEDITDMSHILV